MRKPPDEKNRRMVAKIEEYQKVYSTTTERLAQKVGVSDVTLYSRKKNMDTLKLGELRRIVQALNIPMEEMLPFIL